MGKLNIPTMKLNKINFKFNKTFLYFISLRLIFLLFTFNVFSKLQRGYGDSRFLLGQYKGIYDIDLDTVTSIFSISTYLNQVIITTILPNNIILASVVLNIIVTFIFWINLREFLVFKNSTLLWFVIFLPSFVINTIIPSKESVFISFSLIYICFEAKNIVFRPIHKWNNINILIQRILYVFIGIALRGIGSMPYITLGFFVTLFPLLSPFLLKYKSNKSNLLIFFTISSFIALVCIFSISLSNNPLFSNYSYYLQGSFLGAGANLSREFLLGKSPYELKNFILFPYLSVFPTFKEFSSNPKLIFYVIDSSIYVGIFFLSWNKIINSNLLHPRKIKFIQYLFIAVIINYLIIYGTAGAYNLGSALRFKSNFLNIGHILPLIIFYNCKKQKLFQKTFK